MTRRIGEVSLIGTGLAVFAAGSLLLVASTLPVVLAGCFILGWSLPWLVIGFNTLLQRQTPDQLMGRVSSAADLLVGTPQTISIALGAAMISFVDYRLMLIAVAATVAAAGVYLTTRPEPPAVPIYLTAEVSEENTLAGRETS
jgi:MFS family permease